MGPVENVNGSSMNKNEGMVNEEGLEKRRRPDTFRTKNSCVRSCRFSNPPSFIVTALLFLDCPVVFFQLHFQCPRDKVVRGCAVQFKRQRAVVVLCCTVLCAVAVLVTFFICWAPFHAQRVLTVSVPDGAWTATLIEIQSTLFYVSG